LEKQNAYSKLQSRVKASWYEIPQSNSQNDRQNRYLSNLECFNRFFIEKFPSNFNQTKSNSQNPLYNAQLEEKCNELVILLYQKDALYNFADFIIYDKWDSKIQEQTVSVEPKDEISKKSHLNSVNINYANIGLKKVSE
jgi:hypothetical protein